MKMKKFISEKSTPTVAVSLPSLGDGGGFVKFLREKAGSFSMACEMPKKRFCAAVKIESSNRKDGFQDQNNHEARGKSCLIAIDDEEETHSTKRSAQDNGLDSDTQAKSRGVKSFEDDEEKLDRMHEEAKLWYILQKREELVSMEKEFETLNKDIQELIKKEKEEIEVMEGLMREIERRKEGCRKDKGMYKASDEELE
ncbi:hypothetical protein ONS95_003851 [Cadophora gregata]|uniref:uncharacterized protein n=1 Tax=Cadophora gregata TaxID=51156 RepID=UPI0026DC007C|nr:uncharacterized protein ONS95_003851 [Cadophora gregata]KAK0107145.1 hypothetical protein ONS95_003851 [Cadophora gregata]